MNATLRHALLRAGLSEEDVAARLAVDPKTVRRWTEGRLPYLRHRWELARLLGCDETDLWPQAGVGRSRPEEVVAIYPHRDSMPCQIWQILFDSATREIGILATDGLFLAEQTVMMSTLADRAEAGVHVRVCIRAPEVSDLKSSSRIALAKYSALRRRGDVQIRVHRVVLNNAIYCADDDLLVSQYVQGVAVARAPILHLRQVSTGGMFAAYLRSFEEVWAGATQQA